MTYVLVPGLLSDESVFKSCIAILHSKGKTVVADLTTQDSITKMAQDTLTKNSGDLILIGHSMGARVVFEMVRLASERIKAIIILDTGIHPYKKGEEIRRQKLVDLAYNEGMKTLADLWLPRMVCSKSQKNAKLMNTLTEMVKRKTPEIHKNQIKALLNRPNASLTVKNISCPTLIMVGKQDVWSPVEQHQHIQKAIKGSELKIIDKAGHFAPIEQPKAVTKVIIDWLDSQEDSF